MVTYFRTTPVEAWQLPPSAYDDAMNDRLPAWIEALFKGGTMFFYPDHAELYVTGEDQNFHLTVSVGGWIVHELDRDLAAYTHEEFRKTFARWRSS